MNQDYFKIFDAHLHSYGLFLDSKKNLIEYLDEHGAKITAMAVLIDKKGIDQISEVPITSLLKVIRVN